MRHAGNAQVNYLHLRVAVTRLKAVLGNSLGRLGPIVQSVRKKSNVLTGSADKKVPQHLTVLIVPYLHFAFCILSTADSASTTDAEVENVYDQEEP